MGSRSQGKNFLRSYRTIVLGCFSTVITTPDNLALRGCYIHQGVFSPREAYLLRTLDAREDGAVPHQICFSSGVSRPTEQ